MAIQDVINKLRLIVSRGLCRLQDRETIGQAADELDRLRAILGKYPVDAEGDSVIPGNMLWHVDILGAIEYFLTSNFREVFPIGGGSHWVIVSCGAEFSADRCYSTEEKAIAAKQKAAE